MRERKERKYWGFFLGLREKTGRVKFERTGKSHLAIRIPFLVHTTRARAWDVCAMGVAACWGRVLPPEAMCACMHACREPEGRGGVFR